MKSDIMKSTVVKKLIAVGKRPWLRVPSMLCIFMVLGSYYTRRHFYNNKKRYGSISVIIVFFVMSCSFAFPVFETNVFHTEKEVAEELTDIEVIADDDVIKDDLKTIQEVENTCTTTDDTRYSVDDILGETVENEAAEVQTEKVDAFTKEDWNLVLINKQHPIPDDYTFTLGKIKGSMKCDDRIIDSLLLMLQDAKNDGVNLVICSPYRDISRQEMLFTKKINAYMKKDMSYMEAYKVTSQAVTVPGASEHQIGLALDIVCDKYTILNAGFGDTDAGKWLAENSCNYGFILRYPKGKEYITGIEYEPWHFRYVGKEAACQITEENITLEEFVERL